MNVGTPLHPERVSLFPSINATSDQLHVNNIGPSGVLSNAQHSTIKDSQFNDFGLSGNVTTAMPIPSLLLTMNLRQA
jgi:hypothetical protein